MIKGAAAPSTPPPLGYAPGLESKLGSAIMKWPQVSDLSIFFSPTKPVQSLPLPSTPPSWHIKMVWHNNATHSANRVTILSEISRLAYTMSLMCATKLLFL